MEVAIKDLKVGTPIILKNGNDATISKVYISHKTPEFEKWLAHAESEGATYLVRKVNKVDGVYMSV